MTTKNSYAKIGLVLATAWAFGSGFTYAQSAPAPDIAARVELHTIPSLTLSDGQFLRGAASEGKPVTVTGELRFSQAAGRQPAVVLMHGSGGMGANVEHWARQFNAMGIATFAIDGFTGRGLTNVSANQASLGRLNFIVDIYRSLDILAKHSRIDPNRIALMGFSRGGQAVLFASVQRFHKLWNTSGAEFNAYIPFYPDCMTSYTDDGLVVDKPIRVFGGAADDYNPIAVCKPYIDRLRTTGRDAQLVEYANGPHGFDSPLLPLKPVVSRDAQTVRNCRIVEHGAGNLINTATQKEFTYQDECVARNPHVGGDPEATRMAEQTIKAFLRERFKLP